MSDVTALRAALLPAPGTPLRVVELELAAPGPGEVLVRLRSSGVCQDDLNLLDGTVDVPAPVVPGHEGAGVVEALGEAWPGLRSATTWRCPGPRTAAAVRSACAICRIPSSSLACSVSLIIRKCRRIHGTSSLGNSCGSPTRTEITRLR